jgi:cell division septation protein DedD
MSEKPSLYVVEKKEVIILVILFVLVTVLSFTMGVKYGESVGKKAVKEQVAAEEEAGGHGAEAIGGKLGESAPAHGSPEVAGHDEHGTAAPEKPASREVVEKNSDEYLLNALKESGIEPPGGKAPGDAKLPDEVKRVKSGYYVIQVGSHPTRSEAESQVRQLATKKVSAGILAPFKDRQGEWHRVVVGSFKTKREAEREAAQLKSRKAILSFFVWRLP